ncbi:hypothetical protein JYG23_07820 [Sedimentibacter sp. zth1]|uniref:hypothetical protein n=1 Tax=Sedimentibacter sp. zth1 TaxID=2816908 RepID=UPI001A92671B|nr:hypothetical protein [Sedimentibacter sp. zth1]QSX07240.1 hypothetical protein JYG23_07820 [Sedimentibacter sp. zth1]
MKDFILTNLVGIVLCLIGLLGGGIISFIFYKKSISIAKPVFQYSNQNIIDISNNDKEENLKVYYSEYNIKRLNKTHIYFWNSGNKTIKGEDIVKTEGLKIVFEDKNGRILLAKVLKYSRKVCDFNVMVSSDDRREISFNFDFLDPNDGVVIEVLHTFEKSKFNFTGIIKSIPDGIQNYGYILPTYRKKDPKFLINNFSIVTFIDFVVGVLSIYGAINIKSLPKWLFDSSQTFNRIFLLIFGIFFISFSVIHIIANKSNNKMPRKIQLLDK